MSPPADAKRSPPGPGTATSKPLSAPPPAAENSEPSSRSNGQSSPPSGTCLAPAPTTKTQDRTTTAGTTPANAQLVPCETYEPSATRSPFTPSPWPTKPTSSPVSYQREGQGSNLPTSTHFHTLAPPTATSTAGRSWRAHACYQADPRVWTCGSQAGS